MTPENTCKVTLGLGQSLELLVDRINEINVLHFTVMETIWEAANNDEVAVLLR